MKKYIYSIIKAYGTVAIFGGALMFSVSAFGAEQDQLADHALLASNAWHFLNLKTEPDYKKAIEVANECIMNFSDQADRAEQKMKATNAAVVDPETIVCKTMQDGKLEWTPEASKILKRGPLNDVATCYFIVGEGKSALYNAHKDSRLLDEAKEAYKKATALEHALTYDGRTQSGWFWSPAIQADAKLRKLK